MDVEGELGRGDPAELIVKTADRTKADLIVVGNKGIGEATRFRLGSVPDRVAHSALCDILVVDSTGAVDAGRVDARQYKKLMVGTDGSSTASEAARRCMELAMQLRADVTLVYVYAIPVFVFLALSSTVAAHVAHRASPGVFNMLGVSLIAGFLATTASVIVGIYAAVATYRFGLDPDNHGIPMVTSSLDLLGALSLILAIVLLGLA